ncbi:MAG: DNA polymerase III subunit alpha [bacterium]|nr:DNA polymerase III subunit alpha [bacterium]
MKSTPSPVIHLHCHSNHSLLASGFSPEEIALQAKKWLMSAVAITDTNSVSGAIQFYNACKALGVKPIIGAQITQENNPHSEVVILAKNRAGYQALCQLITRRQLNKSVRIISELRRLHQLGHTQNLILFTPCWTILEAMKRDGIPIYAELTLGGGYREEQWYLTCKKIQAAGIPILATAAVRFAEKEGFDLLRILRAIEQNCSPDNLSKDALLNSTPEHYFKSTEAMNNTYFQYKEALENSCKIAESCTIDLEQSKWELPQFQTERPQRLLNHLACSGLRERVNILNPAYLKRLRYELNMIRRMGFTHYFLVVWDILQYAKANRIPSIGRGSAANSLVSYTLGITHVDPIMHNLYFERFLNPHRSSPPDIDLDFCWRRRRKILAYVFKKYGAKHVAMIATINTLGLRSAFREVGRTYGLNETELSAITKKLPHMSQSIPDIAELKQYYPACQNLPLELTPYNAVYKWAQAVAQFPRHFSVHPGGIIITKNPISHFTAQQASDNGLVVTQHDMYSMESIKLLKIDLLGNRSISVYCDAIDLIKKNGHTPPPTDNLDAVYADQKTQDLIRTGATMGCFYIESPAMRQLLKKLQTSTFEGLTAASSVIRPGVASSGMMQEYIARSKQHHPSHYLHPKMQTILKDTYGVMIYQEDCLKVAHQLAGMSLADADMLRRAISGKQRSNTHLAKYKNQFITGALKEGVPNAAAQKIWAQISSFGSYSFCKAHSASYAIFSFQVAMLKAHFPAEFMASVISNGGGFYDTGAYIAECKRMGLVIELPSVNHSQISYTGQGNTVRIGLMQLNNFPLDVKKNIVAEREEHGPYRHFYDLLSRVRISKREAEVLILSGACNCFGQKQSALLMELSLRYNAIKQLCASQDSTPFLFPEIKLPELYIPCLEDYATHQKCQYELEHLGIMVTRHPLQLYAPIMDANRSHIKAIRQSRITSKGLMAYPKKDIEIIGGCISSKTFRTKKTGKQMKFMSMEDLDGTFEVTLFPDIYEQTAENTHNYGPYIIQGTVEMQFGVPSITARTIHVIPASSVIPAKAGIQS